MSNLLVCKYAKVWVKRRKNRVRAGGAQSVSYTLQWLEFGQERFLSLGPHANLAYARRMAAETEWQLNSAKHRQELDPVSW